MEVDQEESAEHQKSTKTTAAKATAKPFKIPRPANSFMLYRAENGKKYPGLVATELSAKLGEAWRKEPQEIRDRYDEMAEQAKRDHALKYPDYKFAPVKRGTGKRALKLAAEAIANEMAEMDAAALLISMASMAPAPCTVATASTSSHHDQRHYVPISRVHSTSVSATGIRPRVQRPFKVASLNKSIVPISNDPNVSSASIANASLSDNSPVPAHKSSSNEKNTESDNNYNGNINRTEALANDANAAASQQSSRAYPQLSPPLILFREALARRSPQLASSLVAQIVINVWFGVTEELRERYEIMAESDPRFKDKSNYINHSQISGTPTTASEAMMANQIAQLLKKAAAGEQLILPHSNKRKGAASTNSGYSPSTKLARIAPAPFCPPTEPAPAHARSPAIAPAIAPAFAPPQADLASVPALTMPVVPAKTGPSPSPSPVLAEATPAPNSDPEKMATTPSWNDLPPAAMVPMPMASPNKRQTRASAALISMAGYSSSTSLLLSSTSAEKPAKVKKATASKVQKTKVVEKAEEKVTPANRPIRRITRPPRYSA
ncbi:Transcription factor Sox-2 [Linnemannia gamsii]|uniref:Transcription factor Sox-2 n=1 Tax=Linnemannia gamsii TaxID=64522 RepID=A0A9P6R2Q9_9FUNG|nr:Transcription factor Sox-2 [Linnemannia gamsii]